MSKSKAILDSRRLGWEDKRDGKPYKDSYNVINWGIINREIKFRVWDIYRKEFLKYPCYLRHDNFEEFICFDRLFNTNDEDVIIQQYIGLKDKKGKEIYEGDIVNYEYDEEGREPCSPTIRQLSDNYEIYFDGNYSAFKMRKKNPPQYINTYSSDVLLNMNGRLNLIGNIFENLELLKQ